ncbi:MAG: hypothetical protein LBE09_07640 [Christensenellaceae bacterium]|jgi:hypothetical protein|nr:hypothetical protein [Christensenellaceae bacterium]
MGDAPNKSKDAQEKTSGFVDIGLIDDERKLTSEASDSISDMLIESTAL